MNALAALIVAAIITVVLGATFAPQCPLGSMITIDQRGATRCIMQGSTP